MTLDPALGHEQKGRRPALVVSSELFNKKTGLVYICPITSVRKDYPFRIPVETISQQKGTPNVDGYIMVDQLKSVDWKVRRFEYITAIADHVLHSVENCIEVIME